MSCCGQKRAEAMGPATSIPTNGAAVSAPPVQAWNATAGLVRVRYLESVPVAVNGRYTARRYYFSRVNPVQEVDTRDAEGLLGTRYFRREA